jgi:hypothetical protein
MQITNNNVIIINPLVSREWGRGISEFSREVNKV